MESHGRIAMDNPEVGQLIHRDELMWPQGLGDSHVTHDSDNQHINDHWPMPPSSNIDHNMRNVPCVNGYSDFEHELNGLDNGRSNPVQLMPASDEFLGSEGWLYGLEGLLDSIESQAIAHAPIVTAEGIVREQVSHRLLGR
ncbi:hypothetical protein BBOV_II001830 [Babesia bovis T2Bo]|uniref:Uncharacterized protein n=1 Tax=Babesia bovis TaxID=5865 RepID=A7AT78_BABBO|nr:hypothetical protein BBOV_II001830 [Babesia bovis T2Bo]EDO06139.1 hypothetical protein BBOV_II001830 [Babesia bovis T2Bo]|eukprot:XP_001609707.1 hypothetical protein [Babesia bovis T2Bo]